MSVPGGPPAGLAQQSSILDLDHLKRCMAESEQLQRAIAEHLAPVLSSPAHQEVIAPPAQQQLSGKELEARIEAAARAASEADGNLARFLAAHVPHMPLNVLQGEQLLAQGLSNMSTTLGISNWQYQEQTKFKPGQLESSC